MGLEGGRGQRGRRKEGAEGPSGHGLGQGFPQPLPSDLLRLLPSVSPGQEGGLPQDGQLTPWAACPWGCPCTHPRRRGFHPHCHVPLCTWCRAGRLPSRLYHVMTAWGCPATTQFRSKVCPSTTVGDEDSILIGGETLGTGDREGPMWPESASSDYARDLPPRPPPGPPVWALSPWEELLPWMVTISEVSWELAPLLTWHTYSPESAGVTWGIRSREPTI